MSSLFKGKDWYQPCCINPRNCASLKWREKSSVGFGLLIKHSNIILSNYVLFWKTTNSFWEFQSIKRIEKAQIFISYNSNILEVERPIYNSLSEQNKHVSEKKNKPPNFDLTIISLFSQTYIILLHWLQVDLLHQKLIWSQIWLIFHSLIWWYGDTADGMRYKEKS